MVRQAISLEIEANITRLREELLQPSDQLKNKALAELTGRFDTSLKAHMNKELANFRRKADEAIRGIMAAPSTPQPVRSQVSDTPSQASPPPPRYNEPPTHPVE